MKSNKLLYLLVAMMFSIAFVACEEEDPLSCDSDNYAEDFGCSTDIDILATFCSDGINNSYYTYDGVDYECGGIEVETCDTAIYYVQLAVIEDYPEDCATKKSGNFEKSTVKLTAMAEALLEEVRAKSLCD